MQNIILIIEREVDSYVLTPDDGVSNTLHAALRLLLNLAKSFDKRNIQTIIGHSNLIMQYSRLLAVDSNSANSAWKDSAVEFLSALMQTDDNVQFIA